jgi:transcriptional regulator with XRE-family HTH domain
MSRPAKALVNTEELGRAIRRRRAELGLSLRDVATETAVSASTLSRIENGTGKPDADNIARLTTWLDVPMERILSGRHSQSDSTKAVIYYPQEPTPEIVERIFGQIATLTPETAAALSELFRAILGLVGTTRTKLLKSDASFSHAPRSAHNSIYSTSASERFASRRKMAQV